MVEIERRTMDARPSTGTRQVGGVSVSSIPGRTPSTTTGSLEFEPSVKFWDRPFFLGVDRHLRRITGAHDFTPLAATHYTNRLERLEIGWGQAVRPDPPVSQLRRPRIATRRRP